jgi:hypothetical protein
MRHFTTRRTGALLASGALAAAVAVAGLAGLPRTAGAAPPAAALADEPTGGAFVWADRPTAASYTPREAYQENTEWGINTIRRTGVGAYTVNLSDLGAVGGSVLVTAYGTTADYCKVASWGPSGSTQQVNVRCFNRAGSPVDSQFTMSYGRYTGFGDSFGYVWGDRPTEASYTPAADYNYNSQELGDNSTNTIERLGTGLYRVTFPKLGSPRGHVQATAYGSGN